MGITKKLAMAAALLSLPGAAPGQTCGRDGVTVQDLGFGDVSCEHCTINVSPRGVNYRFATEPRLYEIHGPGEGRLREGDVLVAIDGRLITTEEGGDRMAAVRRGQQ